MDTKSWWLIWKSVSIIVALCLVVQLVSLMIIDGTIDFVDDQRDHQGRRRNGFISSGGNGDFMVVGHHKQQQTMPTKPRRTRRTNSSSTTMAPLPPPPLPIQILRQYQTMHSQQTLQREFAEQQQQQEEEDASPSVLDRNFLVAYYNCPHAAGNLLHDLFNQVITAIALNRTLLIKYNDHTTCQYNQLHHHNSLRCQKANTLQDCRHSLRQKSWIPTWDEWIIPLTVANQHRDQNHHQQQRQLGTIHGNSLNPQNYNHNRNKSSTENVPPPPPPPPSLTSTNDQFWLSKLPLRDSKAYSAVDWMNRSFIAFQAVPYQINQAVGGVWSSHDGFLTQTADTTTAAGAQQTLHDLYSLGADFLYGMLFREIFDWNFDIEPPEMMKATINDNKRTRQQQQQQDEYDEDNRSIGTTTRIVLHSRHFDSKDKGGNIHAEIGCLKELLLRGNNNKLKKGGGTTSRSLHSSLSSTPHSLPSPSCEIYVMSDRESSVENLKIHIDHRYHECKTIVATHGTPFVVHDSVDVKIKNATTTTTTGSSGGSGITAGVVIGHYVEHGVWAGVGFMQDIMLATSSVRDGFIGHCYRSSSQLVRELIQYDRHMDALQNGRRSPSNLPTCCLPSN
jgi:hypothetical protein